MNDFRNFKKVDIGSSVINSMDKDTILAYTEKFISESCYSYITLEELKKIMSENHYYVINNFYYVKGKNKFVTGLVDLVDRVELLEYISNCITQDLAENMRFIDTALREGVYILNDDLEIIYYPP